jgi:hypothetical protein
VSSGTKLPFLPFYLNDWETDGNVKMMGPATRYAYFHLLIHQWREGSIPADRGELIKLLTFPSDPGNQCIPEYDLDAILDQVLKRFRSDGRGHLKNRHMEILRMRHIAMKCNLSARGKKGRMKQLTATAQHQAGESESDIHSSTAKNRFQRPTSGEVLAFMRQMQISGAEEQSLIFMDHYESNGWKVGRNPMRD